MVRRHGGLFAKEDRDGTIDRPRAAVSVPPMAWLGSRQTSERTTNMDTMFFDQAAKTWSTPHRIKKLQEIASLLLEKIPNASSKKALEIGSGDGTLALLFSPYLHSIDGIDTSLGMREEAMAKKEQASVSNVFFYDETWLKNRPESYDILYSHKAFHHIQDIPGELSMLHGLARPHARFFLMDLCPIPPSFHKGVPGFTGHHGFSKEEISRYFTQTGWEIESYEIIEKGIKEGEPFEIFLLTAKK